VRARRDGRDVSPLPGVFPPKSQSAVDHSAAGGQDCGEAMSVVMIDEPGKRALEMPGVHDQEPIHTLRPSGPDKPFRDSVRLGDLNRRTYDSRALRLKHDVETTRELAIVVANQESDGVDGEEIHRNNALRLRAQELTP